MAKEKKIKALRIDAITGEVTPVEFTAGETREKILARLSEVYKAISMEGLRPCDGVDSVRIDNVGHYLYVDGEGLLKDPKHFITWKGYSNKLAGHALVIHIDLESGDQIDTTVSPEWVKGHVSLLIQQMVGFIAKQEKVNILGREGFSISREAIIIERRPPGEGPPITKASIAKQLGVPVASIEWMAFEGEDAETAPPENDDEIDD